MNTEAGTAAIREAAAGPAGARTAQGMKAVRTGESIWDAPEAGDLRRTHSTGQIQNEDLSAPRNRMRTGSKAAMP